MSTAVVACYDKVHCYCLSHFSPPVYHDHPQISCACIFDPNTVLIVRELSFHSCWMIIYEF